MPEKSKVLVVFDVDGTLAKVEEDPPVDMYDRNYLAKLSPCHNMLSLVKRYMRMEKAELMFCTGRPKRAFTPTWQWLNRHLHLAASGKRVTLVCRPDEMDEAATPTFKLHEIVAALRRIGTKPFEALIYDDDLANLRLFESLRPMVQNLRLFKVEDGVASQWSA